MHSLILFKNKFFFNNIFWKNFKKCKIFQNITWFSIFANMSILASSKIYSKMHYVEKEKKKHRETYFFSSGNTNLNFHFFFDIGKFDIFLHIRKPLKNKTWKINVDVNFVLTYKSYFAGFPNILIKKKKISILFFKIICFRRFFWKFSEFHMILYNRPGNELSANITNTSLRVEIMLKIKWNFDQK